ncbi:MAG: Uma2 family endonuclease, partial [Desulfobacteraceae bacterium]|nr:Uma2 family endonuclease [Desulfobacteraceae bacterium]
MKTNRQIDPVSLVSRNKYIQQDRVAEFKSEYHEGRVFAMAGASRNHNRIVTNISGSLNSQLKSQDCNNYSSDMRVSILGGRKYVYPDIVVTCGKEDFEDDNMDILLNPIVIIEVLSDSTEVHDRGTKFFYCQTIASLQEYVLISQDKRCFEIYRKQGDGTWVYRSFQSESMILDLQSVNCELTANDVCFKVDGV